MYYKFSIYEMDTKEEKNLIALFLDTEIKSLCNKCYYFLWGRLSRYNDDFLKHGLSILFFGKFIDDCEKEGRKKDFMIYNFSLESIGFEIEII